MLGDPRFVARKEGVWTLDEIAVNVLYCAVANAGGDSQRLMPWAPYYPHPEGIKSQFASYILIGDKFELKQFNDYYFPIVKKIIKIAKSYNIKTWWCLGDGCQFHGAYKKWSPWVTNVNGVSTIYEALAYPYFKTSIEKYLVEFADLGVGYCWFNEGNNPAFRALAKAVIFPFIASGKLAPSNCTYGATMQDAPYVNGEYTGDAGVLDQVKKDVGLEFGDPTKLAIWKEVHGCGKGGLNALVPPNRIDQALSWWARRLRSRRFIERIRALVDRIKSAISRGKSLIRIWLSDDGVKDGTSICDVAEDGARTSAEMWEKIVKLAIGFGNDFVFEHVPQSANLICQAKTLKSIYRTIHGVDPEEKWHYEPPAPPEPEPPTPPSPPPMPKSCYEKYIKNRPISKWQVGAFLRCLFGG
jgi:hypothetical protein